MINNALIKYRLRLLAPLLTPAPIRDTISHAMQDVIAEKEQRDAQERAKDADVRAYLQHVAEQGQREQVERDAQARWESMSEEARARLADTVQIVGSSATEQHWRRTVDAAFVLPTHLRGIAGDAEK